MKKLAFTLAAFTLAEILIVLVVIGVISAILLPVAIQSSPDEKVMKFKKGNATLGKVISELVNSDKYYADGDLGKYPNGNLINGDNKNDLTYFCETIADSLTTKKVNCSEHVSPETYSEHIVQLGSEWGLSMQDAKKALDKACKKYETIIGAEIELMDGVIFYQTHPNYPFGIEYSKALENAEKEADRQVCINSPNVGLCAKGFRLFGTNWFVDENGFDRIYKIFCMDIDGINKGEDPFGYGIRADGKILTGKRADEWINKSMQKGDS